MADHIDKGLGVGNEDGELPRQSVIGEEAGLRDRRRRVGGAPPGGGGHYQDDQARIAEWVRSQPQADHDQDSLSQYSGNTSEYGSGDSVSVRSSIDTSGGRASDWSGFTSSSQATTVPGRGGGPMSGSGSLERGGMGGGHGSSLSRQAQLRSAAQHPVMADGATVGGVTGTQPRLGAAVERFDSMATLSSAASVHFPPGGQPATGTPGAPPITSTPGVPPTISAPGSSAASPASIPARKVRSTSAPTGGYDAEFVNDLDNKYRCPVCRLPLREPVQTDCGHRFCKSCIQPYMSSEKPECPVDNEKLEAIYPDNFCRREVLASHVYCSHRSVGCPWKGPLRDLPNHLDKCEFTVANCENFSKGCTELVRLSDMKEHLRDQCKYRDDVCQYCQRVLPKAEMEAHWRSDCPKVEIDCPNQCGVRLLREEGKRSELDQHLVRESTYHLTLLQVQVSHRDEQLTQAASTIQAQARHIQALEERFSALQAQQEHSQASLNSHVSLLQDFPGILDRLSSLENAAPPLHVGHLGAPASGAVEMQARQAADDAKEAAKAADRALANALATKDVTDNLQTRCSNHDRQLTSVNTVISRMDSILADFDLRILAQETTSYNGILIWKIPDYQRHFQESQSGRKPSIYSPPFYTSRHGYKMCARVYLFGDGVGKGSHMSVFFVVMKGEFDSLLNWPFRQKVTLTLLDQSPAKRHLSDTFMPDPNSSSFHRPSSEMNIASGCPRFVSLDTLREPGGNYVRDNTLFVRIAIDTNGLLNY